MFGVFVLGVYLLDFENVGCIFFWGYNLLVFCFVYVIVIVEVVNWGVCFVVVDF